MPCHSTMGPCECSSCRNAHHSFGELDSIAYNLKDNYQEKYPIKMEELKQLAELKKENNFLEAALCAVLTELEKTNLYKSVVNEASKNGIIDIDSFWSKHQMKDEKRLLAELDKFSEHEKEILKKLLINE
jgi:hypothetical protein